MSKASEKKNKSNDAFIDNLLIQRNGRCWVVPSVGKVQYDLLVKSVTDGANTQDVHAAHTLLDGAWKIHEKNFHRVMSVAGGFGCFILMNIAPMGYFPPRA